MVVIGAGAAGLTVAGGTAVMSGRSCLIEGNMMGGDCLISGCVPSKAFISAASVAHKARNGS